METWRRALWLLAKYSAGVLEPDLFDWFLGAIVGSFESAMWPIVTPFYMLYQHGAFAHIAKPPKHERLRIKEQQLAQRERHIKQLERELGIGDYKSPRMQLLAVPFSGKPVHRSFMRRWIPSVLPRTAQAVS